MKGARQSAGFWKESRCGQSSIFRLAAAPENRVLSGLLRGGRKPGVSCAGCVRRVYKSVENLLITENNNPQNVGIELFLGVDNFASVDGRLWIAGQIYDMGYPLVKTPAHVFYILWKIFR